MSLRLRSPIDLSGFFGSIKRFDERGDVIFYDDFEDAYTLTDGKYDSSVSGAGSVARSNTTSLSGSFSIKLTTDVAADDYARLFKRFGLPITQKVGSEIAFNFNRDLKYFINSMSVYNGTTYYLGQAQIVKATSELQIYKSDSTWQTIASGIKVNLDDDPTLFHHIKLVTDLNAGTYLRCLLNDDEYDISDYDLYSIASTTRPRLGCTFESTNSIGGASESMYIDDFVVTENEPS